MLLMYIMVKFKFFLRDIINVKYDIFYRGKQYQ